MCEHEEGQNHIVARVVLALILFVAGFVFKPIFIAAYLVAGYDVLLRALKNIFKGHIFDENFLMSLATIGAFCIHEFPEAVMVMLLYQIGEYLQDKAVDKSRDSISDLMDIRPDYANFGGQKVAPSEIKIGDTIEVYAGEKIPLDGIVQEGEASVDTSAITGESTPRKAKVGDSVISGCINLDGILKIQVTKEFGESTVSKILELVENASSKKTRTENFITRFAGYYTPVVVVLALLIAFVPPLFVDGNWIERALTFLVISCPCALVISIPLGFFAGIGASSSKGILVKGSVYLEELAKTSTAIFDKTGTLTQGVFEVQKVSSENPDLLKYAACAEAHSSHPIAAAIRKAWGKEIPEQLNIQEIAGKGIRAIIDGKEILVGNAKLTGAEEVCEAGTVVYVSIDGVYAGYIVISDKVKDDSKFAIESLKKLGIKTVMLTGDSSTAAEQVKSELGIDEVYSELLPIDKVNKLEEEMEMACGKVVFTGDGINDAPVLTRADIGISMGALGSDSAIEASDIVIMDDKPSKIVTAIGISKRTLAIVKQNIVFALLVKLAFLILGGFGYINMWGAVFADVGVSLLAVLNALRILK